MPKETDSDKPAALNYAAPDLNRPVSSTDAVPFALGSIQLLPGLLVLLNWREFAISLSKYWYEWPAQIWLSSTGFQLMHIAASAAVVIGAMKVGGERRRWYRAYATILITAAILAMLSFMDLSPWPGERRHRWITIHNLRHIFPARDELENYGLCLALCNPSFWFLIVRSLVRRLSHLHHPK